MGTECSRAIIVVDMQNDFCPGGSLAVTDGDRIIPEINRLVLDFENSRCPVFFTRDWHPENHCSFTANGGMWPSHCVSGTEGADFCSELYIPETAVIISKADNPAADAYSGFQGTDLASLLKGKGITEVTVCGLATDYCVKATVLDALNAGFRVSVAGNAVKAVNVNPGDDKKAFEEMKAAGAEIV